MSKLYFEKMVIEDDHKKIYFTSYLRSDFVERSLVMTLNKNFTVSHIYLNSYEHGSAEWYNGEGLAESRFWESDDQAESSTYLTRRYTVRMANGPAKNEFAEKKIVPDVLDNMADRSFAKHVKRIVAKEKYSRRIIVDETGFLRPVL